jgi:hypothetical protein
MPVGCRVAAVLLRAAAVVDDIPDPATGGLVVRFGRALVAAGRPLVAGDGAV